MERWRRSGIVSSPLTVGAALLGVLVSAPASAPARRAAFSCEGGRFLVERSALTGEDAATGFEVISVDPSGVAISMGCAPATPHVESTRSGGMRVTATWAACAGLLDRTGLPARTKLLRGYIGAPACDTLTGMLVVNRGKPRRRHFMGKRSRCGDGYLDLVNGEECGDEGAVCAPGDRCTTECTCEPTSTTSTIPASSTTSTVTTTSTTATTTTSTTQTTTSSTATTTSSSSTTATTNTTTSSSTTASTNTTTSSSTTATTNTTTSSSTTASTNTTTSSSTTLTTTSTSMTATTVTTTSSSTLTTTSSTSTTLPGSFTCTEILGFSQTLQWHETTGFQQNITDARWEGRFRAGGDVDVWSDPNADVWTAPVRAACSGTGLVFACSPCARGSAAPDRILFTVTLASYESNVQVWVQKIRTAIGTIRSRYPQVRQIVLQPVVGGPNHTVCPAPGQPLGVRASYNHPFVMQAIAQVVNDSPDLVAGIAPVVRQCSDYVDDVGHLTPAGMGPVGLQIGQYYRDAP